LALLTIEQPFDEASLPGKETFMKPFSTCAFAVASLLVVVAACQPRNDEAAQPNQMPTAAYPPPGGQPPPGYPPGTPPPGYPPGTPPGYPPATGTPPPGPAPTGSVAMAVPGPLAFQCKDDVPCGLHHCNLQYGKCAFPCQTAADCLGNNSCVAGLCIPTPPPAH
jgi:hypothetical protein